MFTDIELARPIGYVIKLILNVFVLQINSMLYVRKSFTKFVFLTFQQWNYEQLVTEYKAKAPQQA